MVLNVRDSALTVAQTLRSISKAGGSSRKLGLQISNKNVCLPKLIMSPLSSSLLPPFKEVVSCVWMTKLVKGAIQRILKLCLDSKAALN